MSKPSWDVLTEQLRDDPDPKKRRKACQKLTATGDPAVIPFLRNAYVQDDDDRVRDAARAGLAKFKAMQSGKRAARGLALNTRVLGFIARALAVLFFISLLLNGLMIVLSSKDDAKESGTNALPTGPITDRAFLIDQIQQHLTNAQTLSANLKQEIQNYNATGQVDCTVSYPQPDPVALSDMDKYTYPDLRIAGDRLDVSLLPLQKALVLLRSACAEPSKQTTSVLQASDELNKADAQLGDVNALLQNAVSNPAPTMGPSPTPLPTRTFTPTPVVTLAPGQPTPIPALPTKILAPTIMLTETPIPTATATFTPTPTPTATLPYPDLDYTAILRELRGKYAVMADLTNNYNTGMIDQWMQATTAQGQTTASYCRLSEWPAPFILTPEQQAQLDSIDAADPMLEQAIGLQRQGLEFANQARALYEQSCTNFALASTAQQGLPLAQQALEKLTQSQNIYDAIRARP